MRKLGLCFLSIFCFVACVKTDTITVVSREDGSGTRGAFIELLEIRTQNGTQHKDNTTKEAVVVNKTDVMLMNIASDVNAIGYVSKSALNGEVKAVLIDAIAITDKNYPIARPFFLATKETRTAICEDFIGFILSRQGQAVVAQNGTVVLDNAPEYQANNQTGKLVITGSSSVTPVMEKLKEAYLVQNPLAVIEIQMSDSTSGVTAVKEDNCDIGMVSRPPKESEQDLVFVQIAIDEIAVIVHKDSPISQLTQAQVREIFTGKITSWSDIT